MHTLTAEQRAFFTHIAELAFVNPFSHEREQADWALLGLNQQQRSGVDRKALLRTELERHFEALTRPARFDLQQFHGRTQDIMRLAWIVKTFYSYQQRFDDFIKAQQAEEKSLELPFARELQQEFERSGFTRAQTSHYIALLFQLQRAFRFIDEAVSGTSETIIELRKRLWNNIFTFNPAWYLDYLYDRMEDFSLLLLGETGTGKSLVAKAIGCSGYIPFDLNSRRFAESFTDSFKAINLSQYSQGLLESELFGHIKGAFTGAIDNHPGLFATSNRYGTVFFDEIGDIDRPIQVKLLNVLQDRTYTPVGSRQKQRFAGRVISATNRPIEHLMDTGEFRADFYYRLSSDVIILPSLRERIKENPAELQEIILRLLQRVIVSPVEELASKIHDRIHAVVPKDYHWPGNVRELEQCIRRICVTGSYQGKPLLQKHNAIFQADARGHYLSAQQLLGQYCRFLYGQHQRYETVARIAGLDRRTVKKYLDLEID